MDNAPDDVFERPRYAFSGGPEPLSAVEFAPVFQISLDDILDDEVVARAIFDENGVPMVTAGTKLTPKLVSSLRKHGYNSIFVMGKGTEDIQIDEYLRPEVRRRITGRLRDMFQRIESEVASNMDPRELAQDGVKSFRERLRSSKMRRVLDKITLPITFLKDVNTMIEDVLSQRSFAATLQSIKNVNSLLIDHVMDVTLNTLLLARLYWPQTTELSRIAMGCLFHDIGCLFLPPEIADGNVEMDGQQARQYQLHALYGYFLLHELPQVNLLATHIAFQHHENQDGSGYPRGIEGTNKVYVAEQAASKESGKIHRYANLAAITNLFDRLCMPRPQGHGMTQDQAVRIVHQHAGTRLNAEGAKDFLQMTPAYPLGSIVLINRGDFKGYKAVVARVDPDNLHKPTIRILFDRKRNRLPQPIDVDLKEYEDPIGLRAIRY